MNRVLWTAVAVFLATSGLAQAQQPVEYRGVKVRSSVQNGSTQSSTAILRLLNSSEKPVDVRNTVCEFYGGEQLVKRMSIPRITVQPGEGEYEAPEKVSVSFDRLLCKLGK